VLGGASQDFCQDPPSAWAITAKNYEPFRLFTGKQEVTELFLVCRPSTKKAIQFCIGTRKPSLLRRRGSFLERRSGGANSFGIGRAGETEGSRELGGVEEIGRVVLVEHFIDFAD
jgi:hypothetical protein